MGSTSSFIGRAVPLAGVILFAGLSLLAGCEQGPKKTPTYPVSGELFVKGQPAAGARVILHPAENPDPEFWSRGYPSGRVQPDGKFQIELFDANDGAPSGKYKLLAEWLSGEDGQEENPDVPPRKNQIDAGYLDPVRSPWTVVVEPKSNQLPRFDVP